VYSNVTSLKTRVELTRRQN